MSCRIFAPVFAVVLLVAPVAQAGEAPVIAPVPENVGTDTASAAAGLPAGIADRIAGLSVSSFPPDQLDQARAAVDRVLNRARLSETDRMRLEGLRADLEDAIDAQAF